MTVDSGIQQTVIVVATDTQTLTIVEDALHVTGVAITVVDQLPLNIAVVIQLSERSASDGVITGTNTLGSGTVAFTSADTGRTVVGANFPTGTTLTYVNASVCTLSQACTNGTAQVFTIAQDVYPLRNTVTTDATRNVTWRGCLAPPAEGGYMMADVDDYLSTQ